jgi:hypothetical protein
MTATVCLCVIRLVASEVSRHKTSRYLGSHGLHLQRSHLINNAPAGPGAIGPPRPFRTLSFLPGMVLPDDMTIASTTFPVSGINLLENSAQSWYQAGYVNVRRRFSRGLTFLANYRFVQTTGQPIFDANSRTADRWFNPAAFAIPAAFTFGNVGRNTVYGPGRQTLDLALQREFSMTETVKLQVRAEAFNALNHSNLGTPNRFVNTPQFGTITEASTPGREIQLGVRLSF